MSDWVVCGECQKKKWWYDLKPVFEDGKFKPWICSDCRARKQAS